MRNFFRVAGPMRREMHGNREVLVPRDESAFFSVERARKEREMFRELGSIATADGNIIAALATKLGPLGRIPLITQAEAASIVGLVRRHTRKSFSELAERADLPPLEWLATAIAKSADSAFAGLPKTRGPKALTTRSLAAAVLTEPLLRIEIEAIEVLLRSVRSWEIAEGPRGLVQRAARVLRGRAAKLSESESRERRATAAVLADLGDALEAYARVMPAPSAQTRDVLIEVKRKLMLQPAPTDTAWDRPVPVADDDSAQYEGDPLGLVVRLTLDLWTRFQDEPSGDLWSLPTAPLWSAVWVIAPFLFSAMEQVPAWGVCIHESTDDWRHFGLECRAWARALDALREHELRPNRSNQDTLVQRVGELFGSLRSALGDNAPYAEKMVETARGNERNTLERFLELRLGAAAIAPVPPRLTVLGTEGRALAAIQVALGRTLTLRRCGGIGCSNVLSVDAPPQTRKCKDCIRETGRKRQTRHRERHRPSQPLELEQRVQLASARALHAGTYEQPHEMPTQTARSAPEADDLSGGRRERPTNNDGTRPVKEQVPSKGGER